ncbi:hypothetical protein OIDMADRAFT_148350 [Oidiodendron maius Zn]|uniref:WSC domain-containing protein n=1 Tax=Oidiodendron maius (strain Zn) TaxID=913774 RepID=A0A0C3CC64_OIDMZ|nr:hypothetical protein OIDMADRAFT_148350 [Oidiodendron maius Zn]
MMISTVSTSAILATVILLTEPVLGYFRMSCSLIQMGRVDPVLSYGTVSQHVHKISGASNININSTYARLQEAACTSCEIQKDKSAYWTPQLYYEHANGTFEEVPNGGMAVYYLGRGVDAYGNPNATPFPPGFKMFSGNNNARTYDSETMTWGNSTYPPTEVANRVTFACLNYANEPPQTYNMSSTNCPDGLRAQIEFQSCWDGVNLFEEDQSHVAYLSQIDNGACPPTHPVLFPHLFFEVLYSTASIATDGGQFVFANGDLTGFGFHGDFINGWDIPTLTAAIPCLINDADGVIAECPALAPSDDLNFATDCVETSPIFPCEPVHGLISKLPGCIIPVGYGQTVTTADNTCPNPTVAACNPNYDNEPPVPYPGNSKWTNIGCYTEATNARALTGDSYVSSTNMTGESCLAFCAGFTYAGVEYSEECYCGNTRACLQSDVPLGESENLAEGCRQTALQIGNVGEVAMFVLNLVQ